MPLPDEFLPQGTREQTIARLKALMQGINANKGTQNCGWVALRLDEILRYGPSAAHSPVPVSDAKITTEIKYKDSAIIRSYTEDPRLLALHQAKQAEVVYDLTDEDKVVMELDSDAITAQDNKMLKLTKVDRKTLNFTLGQLPKDKYGRAYGFLIYTWKKKHNQGHIVNFYVDSNNEVYILDAQDSNEDNRVLTKPPIAGYKDELFYFRSLPPKEHAAPKVSVKVEPREESLLVKAPVITKAEPLMPNESTLPIEDSNQELAQAMLPSEPITINILGDEYSDSAANRNRAYILELLQLSELTNGQKDSIKDAIKNDVHVRDKSNLSMVAICAKKNQENLVNKLLALGADIQGAIMGAVLGAHSQLVDNLLKRLPQQRHPELQQIAEIAAEGGNLQLIDKLIARIELEEQIPKPPSYGYRVPYEKRPDLQMLAKIAAQHRHLELVEHLITCMIAKKQEPDLQLIAQGAALGGHIAVLDKIIARMKLQGQVTKLPLIAYQAAFGGHADVLDYILAQMDAQEQMQKLQLIKQGAILGNRPVLAQNIDQRIIALQQALSSLIQEKPIAQRKRKKSSFPNHAKPDKRARIISKATKQPQLYISLLQNKINGMKNALSVLQAPHMAPEASVVAMSINPSPAVVSDVAPMDTADASNGKRKTFAADANTVQINPILVDIIKKPRIN